MSWATVKALSGSAVPCSKKTVKCDSTTNDAAIIGIFLPSGKRLCFSLFHMF